MYKEYNINDIICDNRCFNYSLYHTYRDLLLEDKSYDPIIHINERNQNNGAAEWLQACRDCDKFTIKCKLIKSILA